MYTNQHTCPHSRLHACTYVRSANVRMRVYAYERKGVYLSYHLRLREKGQVVSSETCLRWSCSRKSGWTRQRWIIASPFKGWQRVWVWVCILARDRVYACLYASCSMYTSDHTVDISVCLRCVYMHALTYTWTYFDTCVYTLSCSKVTIHSDMYYSTSSFIVLIDITCTSNVHRPCNFSYSM